jgi:hypothetical protein
LMVCNLQEYYTTSNSNGNKFSDFHSNETCAPVNESKQLDATWWHYIRFFNIYVTVI